MLREPRALIDETTATLPGLDGRKMSKSYDNTIPLLATRRRRRKLVRRIVTDSTPPEAPKDPDACTLVALLRVFADASAVAEVEARYRDGGIGYGEVKALLADVIERTSRRCATATSGCSPTLPSSTPDWSRANSTPPARRPDARPHDGRHGPVAPTACEAATNDTPAAASRYHDAAAPLC